LGRRTAWQPFDWKSFVRVILMLVEGQIGYSAGYLKGIYTLV